MSRESIERNKRIRIMGILVIGGLGVLFVLLKAMILR